MIEIETGEHVNRPAPKLRDGAFDIGYETAEAGTTRDMRSTHCLTNHDFMMGYVAGAAEFNTKIVMGAILQHHPKPVEIDADAIRESIETLDWDALSALAAAVTDPKPPLEDSELSDLLGEDDEDKDQRDPSDFEEDRKRDLEDREAA